MLRREVEIKARLRAKLEEEFRKKDVSKPPKKREVSSLSETDRILSEAIREKQPNPSLLFEARKRLTDLLEGRGKFVLSEEDFGRYFTDRHSEHRGFRQGNSGDCYVVAALHALSESPNFEMLMRSSCWRLPDGTWKVRIPLLDERGATISISPEEISSQRNTGFLGWDDYRGLDRRRVIHPLQGSEGIRVLEAAYIKAKFGSVNRLAAEGGSGDEVLVRLLGKGQVIGTSFRIVPSENTGRPGERTPPIHRFLQEFNPEVSLVTVSSRHFTPGWWDKIRRSFGFSGHRYRGTGTDRNFVKDHAYSLTRVDRKNGKVVLADPWDTSEPIELSLDQLRDNFEWVNAVRLDHARLLENAIARAKSGKEQSI